MKRKTNYKRRTTMKTEVEGQLVDTSTHQLVAIGLRMNVKVNDEHSQIGYVQGFDFYPKLSP